MIKFCHQFAPNLNRRPAAPAVLPVAWGHHLHVALRRNPRRLGLTIWLENGYRFNTKGMMQKARGASALLKKDARQTMSCSSLAKARWAKDEAARKPNHCGYCVPCIICRAAMLEGFGSDDTSHQIPHLRAEVLDSATPEGAHVRGCQIALLRLPKQPNRTQVHIHRPVPLTDQPSDLAAY